MQHEEVSTSAQRDVNRLMDRPIFNEPQHTRPLSVGLVWAAVVPILIPAVFYLVVSGSYRFIIAGATLFIGLPVSIAATFFFARPYVRRLSESGRLYGRNILPRALLVGSLTCGFTALVLYRSLPALGVGLIWGVGFGLVAGLALCLGSGIPFRARPKSG